MQAKFEKGFDSFAIVGEYISTNIGPFTVKARIESDEDSHIDDDDSHNPDTSVTGCNAEQQASLLAARQAWFNNEWFYCGICLELWLSGKCLDDNLAGSWSIECNYPNSDNRHLLEVANDLLSESIDQIETIRLDLVNKLQTTIKG